MKHYFPVFGLNTEIISRKYGPEITPYLDILHSVKVSYSCMSNMSSILSSHNLNVIYPYKTQTYCYNCRTKESCPLQNQCLTPKIIYRANVENYTNSETKFYFGLTETPFKERFGNQTRDFRHKTYYKSTEIFKYIWDL